LIAVMSLICSQAVISALNDTIAGHEAIAIAIEAGESHTYTQNDTAFGHLLVVHCRIRAFDVRES